MASLLIAAIWAGVLTAGSEGLTVLAAARDSDAARRFAKLSGATVADAIDKARNSRWHRDGALQRALYAFLLVVAVIGAADLSWRLFFPGCLITAGFTWRRFDRALAVRFGKDKDYLGTTSELDREGLASKPLRYWGTIVWALGCLTWLLL